MAGSFQEAALPQKIILTGVRWSVAKPPSTRHVATLMEERRVEVEHAPKGVQSSIIALGDLRNSTPRFRCWDRPIKMRAQECL